MSDNNNWSALPSHWSPVKLGDLGEWGSGGTPKSTNKAYYSGEIPWLKIGDLNGGKVCSSEDTITDLGLSESSAKLVPEGALLVAMYGSIGKLGITGCSLATNQAIAFCIPNRSKVDLKYFYWAIRYSRPRLVQSGKGGVQKNISQTVLKDFKIPLPPLDEQRDIVAKIEELFSNLDAGAGSLQTAQKQLERYRLSVLQAAVEGRLTAQWRQENRDVEPAEELLKRILEEHRQSWERNYRAKYAAKMRDLPKRWKSRYSEPELGDYGDLPVVPEGWRMVRLECLLSQKLRNGKSAKTAKDGDGVRVLTLSAVTDGEFSRENTKIGKFNPEKVEDLWLEPGDLLIERSNTPELVGTARLYSGDRNFAIFPDLVIRARVHGTVVNEYAELVLQSHQVQTYFSSEARGTSGSMQKINQTIIKDLPFPVPPLPEQKAIVDEVERLLSVAEDTVQTVENENTRAARLRQSILKQAFSGTLVPHRDSPGSSDTGSRASGDGLPLEEGTQTELDI